ncbi:MAG: GspE/PulE family protein [Vicinamibacterales bacterium]
MEPLARILLEERLLTETQLARALRVQSKLEVHKPLATLIVDLGWVSRAQLETALKSHRKQLSVEEILVEKGVITRDQLVAAERAVGNDGQTAGRHLVSHGAVSERVYLEAYAEKHDLPFVDADVRVVDAQVLKKVSLKYLARHGVLPLSTQGGRLNVLVSDASNRDVLAELERLYGCSVAPCIGESAKIQDTIAALETDSENPTKSAGAIQYHRITQANEDGKAAAEIVDYILTRALREGASDIHVEPMQSKVRVRFRVDGSLVHASDYPISYAPSVISRIKVLAQADIAEHRVHQDGRVYVRSAQGEEVDLRASFYVTVYGENAVLRVLRKSRALVGLEEMGFSPGTLKMLLEEGLEPTTGVLLVCGPTGSGKTTTLYAAVERLNDVSKKVITCEDPVEYVVDGITQCSVANRPGINFVDSLRAIVRQDPDIILIGEIRDRESAEIAVQAALTGHKVLTTFHTDDTIGALVRLVEMNIEPFLIASTITAVLAQRLVRRQCPYCRGDYSPTAAELRALSLQRDDIAAYPLTKGRGCPHCFYTGYRGRTGVFELLLVNDVLRDAIMRKLPAHEMRRLAFASPGFVCLQEDGITKSIRGETTLSEIAENCPRSKIVRPLPSLLEMYT